MKAEPATLEYFAAFVADNWSRRRVETGDDDLRQLFIMSTGLAGETGEVLEHLKKHVRDGVLDRVELSLELGDVLHYWIRICQQFDIDPLQVMGANVAKILERRTQRDSAGGAA